MAAVRVSGRGLAIGLVGFTAVFAVGLWYAQLYAFYEETAREAITIAGESYPVADWQGIDATSSPLKLRACFRLETAPEAPLAEDPTPLVAPPWFDCFDAEAIGRALEEGRAVAYLAEAEDGEGVDRIVARLPDGRAFMWRQLAERYARQ